MDAIRMNRQGSFQKKKETQGTCYCQGTCNNSVDKLPSFLQCSVATLNRTLLPNEGDSLYILLKLDREKHLLCTLLTCRRAGSAIGGERARLGRVHLIIFKAFCKYFFCNVTTGYCFQMLLCSLTLGDMPKLQLTPVEMVTICTETRRGRPR